MKEAGNAESTERALRQALEIDPRSLMALDYLGHLHLNQIRTGDATISWKEKWRLQCQERAPR